MKIIIYGLILCVTIEYIAALPFPSNKVSNSIFKSKLLRSIEDIISNNHGHKSKEEDPDIRSKKDSKRRPCPKKKTVELDAQEIDIYDVNQGDINFTIAEPNVTTVQVTPTPIKKNKFRSKLESLKQKTNSPKAQETPVPDMVPIFKPRRSGQPTLPTEIKVRENALENIKIPDQSVHNDNQTLEINSPLNLAYLNSLVSSGVVNKFGRDPMSPSVYIPTPAVPNEGTPPYAVPYDPSMAYAPNALPPNGMIPYLPSEIPYDPNSMVAYVPNGPNIAVPMHQVPYEYVSEMSMPNTAMPSHLEGMPNAGMPSHLQDIPNHLQGMPNVAMPSHPQGLPNTGMPDNLQGIANIRMPSNFQGMAMPMPYYNTMAPLAPQTYPYTEGAVPSAPAFPNAQDSTMVIYKPEMISLDQIQGDYLKRTTMTVLVPLQTTKLDSSMAMNF